MGKIDSEKVQFLVDEGICLSKSDARRICISGGFDHVVKKHQEKLQKDVSNFLGKTVALKVKENRKDLYTYNEPIWCIIERIDLEEDHLYVRPLFYDSGGKPIISNRRYVIDDVDICHELDSSSLFEFFGFWKEE